MNRTDPPWLSPPAIVQPHVRPVRRVSEAELLEAITAAVRHAIDVVGIEGLKRTSMFPSSKQRVAEDRNGSVPASASPRFATND